MTRVKCQIECTAKDVKGYCKKSDVYLTMHGCNDRVDPNKSEQKVLF